MNTATATIWRFHCDPTGHTNVDLYRDGNRVSRWRSLSPIELGGVIDDLASAELRKVFKVTKVLVENERLPRKCREIECDHCHGGV